jgi:hypothetical protein
VISQRCSDSKTSGEKPHLRDFVDSWRERDQAIGNTPRSRRVTVCVATHCMRNNEPVIIGASDRMMTSELIQFEPRMSKWYSLADDGRIVAMFAGDTEAQGMVCSKTKEAKPKTAERAAEIFSAELATYNRKQAERKILAPLGFSMRSFFDRQVHLSPEFVEDVLHQIKAERANVRTLICGSDAEFMNIYTVDDYGRVTQNSSNGFAAIGDGAWHAQSQLMYAKYDSRWEFNQALLITYIAKRRAEVTPGVGAVTDMFAIDSRGLSLLKWEITEELDRIYDSINKEQANLMDDSYADLKTVCNECGDFAYQEPVDPPPTPPKAKPRKSRQKPA